MSTSGTVWMVNFFCWRNIENSQGMRNFNFRFSQIPFSLSNVVCIKNLNIFMLAGTYRYLAKDCCIASFRLLTPTFVFPSFLVALKVLFMWYNNLHALRTPDMVFFMAHTDIRFVVWSVTLHFPCDDTGTMEQNSRNPPVLHCETTEQTNPTKENQRQASFPCYDDSVSGTSSSLESIARTTSFIRYRS